MHHAFTTVSGASIILGNVLSFVCADVEIGFDKAGVTVIEGETALLNAPFKNNITAMDYAGYGFSVYIYDKENATGN